METNVIEARSTSDPAPSGKPRRIKHRAMVPIGPTETIRHRLQMNEAAFGIALGYSAGAYSELLRKGQLTKTTALAAEALMRRQASSGEVADEVYVLRVVKGAPTTTRVENLKQMTLDGVEYLLVPAKA